MSKHSKTRLLAILNQLYPEPKSELNFTSPYQLTVAVILSAQCTDKKVNQVTPILFKRYRTFRSLANAKLGELEQIIRPINYYKTKARNLIAMADRVTAEFEGALPPSRNALMELPGIGQKTANVIAGELGFEPTLPVDTHVFRVSHRLGLATGKTPERVEEQLKAQFEPRVWRPIHHWLILHGRRVCKAQRPLCGECQLSTLCPSAGKQ